MARVSASSREIRVLGQTFPVRNFADGRVWSYWYHGSERRRVTRTTREDLKEALETIATRVANGELDANELRGIDARALVAAKEALVPFGDLQVDVAAREYAEARKIIGGASLVEAARFYQQHASRTVERTFGQVVDEFLQAKEADRVSEAYGKTLKQDLTRAKLALGARVLGTVTTAELAELVAKTGQWRREGDQRVFRIAGGKRRNQVRATFVTLLNWAKSLQRRYLPSDRPTAADAIDLAKVVSQGNPVYSPAQIHAYLEACRQHAREWVPYLAIGAFCGMRTGAIQRLDWSAFAWESRTIEVGRWQSKVAQRYLAPLNDTLLAWLSDWRHASGPVVPPEPVSRLTRRLKIWTTIPWEKNALRSSYISYRYAQTGDAALVAGECNTSAKEVMKEYRDIRTVTQQLVTRDLAEAWFGIQPAGPANVVQAQFRFAE